MLRDYCSNIYTLMYLLLWMSNGAEGLLLCTILSFVTKGINLGGASGMITMSKYYERTLYQQLLLLLFIKGRIGNSGTGIYLRQFGLEVTSAVTPCCRNSQRAEMSPCLNFPVSKCRHAKIYIQAKCPYVKMSQFWKIPVLKYPWSAVS